MLIMLVDYFGGFSSVSAILHTDIRVTVFRVTALYVLNWSASHATPGLILVRIVVLNVFLGLELGEMVGQNLSL